MMDRILKHSFNFGPNLSRSKFCDAKVRAKDSSRLIPVHRILLAAVSKKFEKIFEENLGQDITYVIPDVKFETLRYIVDFIYSRHAVFSNDEVYKDFCVGLVILSINLGEVENIENEVETKPDKEEYFEMNIKGRELKSEMEENNLSERCGEPVTSLTKCDYSTRFFCKLCHKSFPRHGPYLKHKNRVHSVPCLECDFVFTNELLLEEHMGSIHGIISPPSGIMINTRKASSPVEVKFRLATGMIYESMI